MPRDLTKCHCCNNPVDLDFTGSYYCPICGSIHQSGVKAKLDEDNCFTIYADEYISSFVLEGAKDNSLGIDELLQQAQSNILRKLTEAIKQNVTYEVHPDSNAGWIKITAAIKIKQDKSMEDRLKNNNLKAIFNKTMEKTSID